MQFSPRCRMSSKNCFVRFFSLSASRSVSPAAFSTSAALGYLGAPLTVTGCICSACRSPLCWNVFSFCSIVFVMIHVSLQYPTVASPRVRNICAFTSLLRCRVNTFRLIAMIDPHALRMLSASAGPSESVSVRMRPRYLNCGTLSILQGPSGRDASDVNVVVK
eukprot:PhF_6_TR31884/c1_g1_i4/m.47405